MAMDDQNTQNQFSPMGLQMQQAEIARQRAIAQYLQEQSLQSPQGQMVSGHYVAPNPMQYVSKLAQGLIGKNMQSDLDARQSGLVNQYNANMLKVAQALKGDDQDTSSTAPAQFSPSSTMPSNPAVANSPVNLPTENGEVQTFKQAPQYVSPNSDSPQSQTSPGMISNAAPVTRRGGNPIFKDVGLPAISNYLQDPNSALGKLAGMQIQANLKNMEPTELIKTMRAAGIDENSPLGRQFLQGNLYKQNYIAPTSLRPGGYVQNADGTRQQLPSVPEGHQAVDDGQGGWKIVPVSGGQEAIERTGISKARGPATFNTQKVWNPQTGQYEYSTAANVADAAGGGAGGASAQNAEPFKGANLLAQLPPNVRAGILQSAKADPSGRFSLNYQLPNGQRIVGDIDLNSSGASPTGSQAGTGGRAFAAEPPLGTAAATDVMATANAKGYQDLKTQAAGAADRMSALDQILDLANGDTKYGPGTSARVAKLSSLNSVLPSGMAFGNDDIANAQIMQKWVSNLAGQYMKALGGTGTDAQLENSLKSIANPDMMNQAIREVVPKLKALEAAVQAKANAYDQWLAQPGNSVDKGNLFENQFRRIYDPRIFQLNMMSPNEQRAFVSRLSPDDAKALLAKRQQLRTMGAF